MGPCVLLQIIPCNLSGDEEEEPETASQKGKPPTWNAPHTETGVADVEKTQGYQSWLRRSTPRHQKWRTGGSKIKLDSSEDDGE